MTAPRKDAVPKPAVPKEYSDGIQVVAPKAPPVLPAIEDVKSKKLKTLPNLGLDVKESQNLRMKTMARPICPVDPRDVAKWGPNAVSCIRLHNGYPGWWDYCSNQGHNPYYTTYVIEEVVDVVDAEGYVTGTKKRRRTEERLNLTQVAIGTRFSSGRGLEISKGLKGRKTLTEMGYRELCEYRNCESPATIRTAYGDFCGQRHARLIGADVENILPNAGSTRRDRKENEDALAELDLGYDGAYKLQLPGDAGGTNIGTDTWGEGLDEQIAAREQDGGKPA